MSFNDFKLPPINNPKPESTMRLPNDNQLLLQQEQATPIQQKQQNKIWDKKTASCRSKLKRFDNYQTAVDDKYVPINSFNQKQKKLIENALEVIQMRKKNKDLVGKNQTIVQILEQKKEMFLVTMTHGIIQKEIQNLTSQTEQRSKALLQSNQILQKDKQDFEQYYQKYKAQTKKIEQQFQKQVQKRLAKEQQIKARQITVNSLRTLKVRNQQAIASALRYKNFLNQLPPNDWIEKQSSRRQRKVKEVKQKIRAEWNMSSSSLSKKSSVSTQDFQKHFSKLKQSGQNEQIEEILYDEEMYFKEPSELIQFFNNLQENNLFNIQNSHIAEQKYQELKIKSEEKKTELLSAFESHKQQKRLLEKQLLELDNQIKHLKKKKEQNSLLDEKDNKDIKATITQEYDSLREIMGSGRDNPYLPQLQSKSSQSLTVLSAIQICMERLWQKLVECYVQSPADIKKLRIQLQKNKNTQKRQQTALQNKLQEQKRKNRNNQKKQIKQKVIARIDMKRSPPQQRIVVKKVQTTNKDDDDDKKYLVE